MSFESFQEQVNQAKSTSEDRRRELKVARQKASNIKAQKAQLLREIDIEGRDNDERLIEIISAEETLAQAAVRRKSDYAGAVEAEWATLHEFLDFTNPVENIAFLEDDCPILLFPLR